MKCLIWLRANINFVSVLVGLGFVISGKTEMGKLIIDHGGML